MKKSILLLATCLLTLCASAQCIERVSDFEGGKVEITSAVKLFSGCQLRLCTYIKEHEETIYGIELDFINRATYVSEGNIFTIYFKDGSKITLYNLWDTTAEVTQESRVETYHHTYTDFVPVYDAWVDAVYGVPVTGSFAEHVPVTRTTTYTTLYYLLTPEQINKIATEDVKEVSIVTNEETIVKKARPLSQAVAQLRGAIGL